MKHIGILIDPKGNEWFDSYGPLTKDRNKATHFVSAEIADKAAQTRMGQLKVGFWDCELQQENKALIEFRGWTNRTEPVNL